jgi:hypothetical protein
MPGPHQQPVFRFAPPPDVRFSKELPDGCRQRMVAYGNVMRRKSA